MKVSVYFAQCLIKLITCYRCFFEIRVKDLYLNILHIVTLRDLETAALLGDVKIMHNNFSLSVSEIRSVSENEKYHFPYII